VSDKKYHVASLIPHEQLVLKLLLKNMVKYKTKEIMNKIASDPDTVKLELKYKDFTRLFNSFEELSGPLPTYTTVERAKSKLFYFTDHGINFMLEALHTYEGGRNYGLDSEDVQLIEEFFPQLKSLLSESKMHLYSADEISKALKVG
jgi:hypothetical protein